MTIQYIVKKPLNNIKHSEKPIRRIHNEVILFRFDKYKTADQHDRNNHLIFYTVVISYPMINDKAWR